MASEDRILKILLQIQSDLSGLNAVKGGIGDLKKTIDDTAKSGFSLGDAFKFAGAEEGLRRMIDFVKEIPVQIEEGIKKGIEFDAQIQVLQTRLAGILSQTQPDQFKDWASAFAAAGDEVDALKAKANELGIEYNDLFESFAHIQAVLSAAGIKDFNQQLDLSVQLTRALQTVGVSASVAFRDIGDILRGQASIARVGGTALASLMGFPSPQELDVFVNQHRVVGDLQQAMMDKLKGIQATSSQLGQTFTAEMNRMKNALLDLEGEAAQPIMQPLTQAIQELGKASRVDDVKAYAMVIGDLIGFFIKEAEAIGTVVQKLGELNNAVSGYTFGAINLSPTAGLVAAAKNAELAQIQTEEYEKQSRILLTNLTHATTQEEKGRALGEIVKAISDTEEKIHDGQVKNVAAANDFIAAVRVLLSMYETLAGIVPKIAPSLPDQTKQLEAIKKITDDLALKEATRSGDMEAIAEARAQRAYDETLKILTEKNVEKAKALQLAKQEYDETYKDVIAQQSRKDSQKDITAFLREESLILEQIHSQQQIIAQNPFLSVGQRQDLQIPLIISEIGQLNSQIQQGQALLKGGTLDPEQYDRVAKAVDTLRTRVQLLGFQLQTSTFGGGFEADLTKWVNSFGTAAQQAANILTSTLNTAIGGTAQALTGLITGTKNWQQAFAQAATSIIESIIRIALQFVVSQIVMRVVALATGQTTGAAANAQAASAAAAWAPAATAASIASYGAAGVAGTTALAGAGGAGALKGGFLGNVGEGKIAGPVHGQEFVFTAEETRALGVPFLSQLAAAAGGTAKFPRYDSGGAITVEQAGALATGGADPNIYFDQRTGQYVYFDPSIEPTPIPFTPAPAATPSPTPSPSAPGGFQFIQDFNEISPNDLSMVNMSATPSVVQSGFIQVNAGDMPLISDPSGAGLVPSTLQPTYVIPPEDIPIPPPPAMPDIPPLSDTPGPGLTARERRAEAMSGGSGGVSNTIGSGISGGPTSFESASSGLFGAFEGGTTLLGGFGIYTGGIGSGMSGGGLPVKYLHEGGPIDEVHILAQAGEFMMQERAHDYYGSAFMHDVNNMRIDAGALRMHSGGQIVSPSLGLAGSPPSGGSGRAADMKLQVIHVNNWREAIKKALESSDIRTAIIDMINSESYRLGNI